MLHLTQTLPPGALIGGESRALTQALGRTNGAWFTAREEHVLRDGDRITGWREASGAVDAVITEPNTGNSLFDPGPPAGFLCKAGLNCGFVIPDFAPEVNAFTAAVIYTSPNDAARSLLAVSTGQSNNVIFLNESDGKLVAKDRQNTAIAELPVPHEGSRPRLAIMSYTGGALLLLAGGKRAAGQGRPSAMNLPGQFFIGCRSNRSGLAKTLGHSRLHDVVFWPDRALLGSNDPFDVAALAAVARYHRWTY
jgi:hypothetical protein